MMEIPTGEQLRDARERRGWTVKRLSEESGLSVRTIGRFEDCKGEISCHPGTLFKLQRALEELTEEG